jgi:hypothetical protein
MGEAGVSGTRDEERARRRAAGELIGRYHEEQLLGLIDHVRRGIAQLDADEIDVFELDEIIHHYKRATIELWKFCNGRPEQVAGMLEFARERGEEPDWWDRGASRRRRSET